MSRTKTHADKKREQIQNKSRSGDFDLESKIMAPPPFSLHIDDTAEQTELIAETSPKDKAEEKGTPKEAKHAEFSDTPLGISPLTEKGAKNLSTASLPPSFSFLENKIAEDKNVEEADSEKEASQLKAKGKGFAAPSTPPPADEGNNGGLPSQLKAGIESLSGVDMSDVQVNYGSSKPGQMNALAVAQGTSIDLAPGQEQHLPHEAWHVAQQKQGKVTANTEVNGNPVNDDPGLEREADVMGAKAAQMKVDAAPGDLKKGRSAGSAQLMAAPMQLMHEKHFEGVKEVPIPKDESNPGELVAEGIPEGEEVPPEFAAQKAEYDTFVENGGDPAKFKGFEQKAKATAKPAEEGAGKAEPLEGDKEGKEGAAPKEEGEAKNKNAEGEGGGGEGEGGNGSGQGGGSGEGGDDAPQDGGGQGGGEQEGAPAAPMAPAAQAPVEGGAVNGSFGAGKEPTDFFVINRAKKDQVGDGPVLSDLGGGKFLANGLAGGNIGGGDPAQLQNDGDPPQQVKVPGDVTKESLESDREASRAIVASFQSSGLSEVERINQWNANLAKAMESKAEAARKKINSARRTETMNINLSYAGAVVKTMANALAAQNAAKTALETTLNNIRTGAENARTAVKTAFTTNTTLLDTLASTVMGQVDTTLAEGKKGMIDAATTQGDAAKAYAETRAAEYESDELPEMGFWDKVTMGPWYEHRKRSARANAARETGKGFAESFLKTAQEECAAFDGSAKSQLSQLVTENIAAARQEMQTAHDNAVRDITQKENDDIQAAQEASQTARKGITDNCIKAITSLNQERQESIRLLNENADKLVTGIDTQAQQLSTSLSTSATQAASEYTRSVNAIATEAGNMQDPNPADVQAEMDKALAGIQTGITGLITSLDTTLNTNGAALMGMADQGVTGLQGLSSAAAEGAKAQADGAKQMFDGAVENFKTCQLAVLEQGATAFFTQMGDGVAKFIGDKYTETQSGFDTVISNLKTKMTENAQGLDTDFAGQVTGGKLDAEITTQAEKAAEAVPSIYAIIVSWAVKILIAIVITAICCALIASGVGLLTVILVGAVLGAVGGAITYGLDCGLGLQEFSWGGLGMAVASGAVSGAITGISAGAGAWISKGMEGMFASPVKQFVAQWAVETVVGTGIDTLGSGFTEMMTTGNWNLDTFLGGMKKNAVNNLLANGIGGLIGAKLAKSPRFQAFASKLDFSRYFKTASSEATESALESAARNIDAPKTPEIDAPKTPEIEAPKTPEVEAPKTPEVEAPKTPEVEAPKTPEVEAPKTPEVDAPKTPEVEAPKTPEVEAPKTPEVEAPKTPEVEAPKTPEVEAPKTPEVDAPKGPEAEGPKTPETETPKTPENNAPKSEEPKGPKDNDPNAPKDSEPDGPKDHETDAPKDGETDAPKDGEVKGDDAGGKKSGEDLRSSDEYKYPEAPEGYHWVNSNGKPTLRRNPGNASKLPPASINPVTKKFEVDVPAPRGYNWEYRNGQFNLRRNPNMADTLPKLEYDPSTGGFREVGTGKPYGGDLTSTPARGTDFENFKSSIGGEGLDPKIATEAFELWKLKKWGELEKLFNANGLNGGWPPNRGFMDIKDTVLEPGFKFDRYGGYTDSADGLYKDKGTFVAPDNAPFGSRALPASTKSKPYHHYEVIKPIPGVKEGGAIPWFGQPGKGMQYELPGGIDQLIKDGYIVRLDPTAPKLDLDVDAPKMNGDGGSGGGTGGTGGGGNGSGSGGNGGGGNGGGGNGSGGNGGGGGGGPVKKPGGGGPPKNPDFDVHQAGDLVSPRMKDGAPYDVKNPHPDGNFRLNRKKIQNGHKIVGQPEAEVHADAAREAFAAQQAANRPNVEKVYLGKEADKFVNGSEGKAMSVDSIAVTKKGQYILGEAKGKNITHGLEQLKYTAEALGKEQVIRYEIVMTKEIQKGFKVINRQLFSQTADGSFTRYLIYGKPVFVTKTQ